MAYGERTWLAPSHLLVPRYEMNPHCHVLHLPRIAEELIQKLFSAEAKSWACWLWVDLAALEVGELWHFEVWAGGLCTNINKTPEGHCDSVWCIIQITEANFFVSNFAALLNLTVGAAVEKKSARYYILLRRVEKAGCSKFRVQASVFLVKKYLPMAGI